MNTQAIRWAAVAAALFVLGSKPARADVYDQTFDSGSASFTVGNPYWTDPTECNNYIVQSTNSSSVCGNEFGSAIPNDVSGAGYFLFDSTTFNPPIGSPGDEFFISPTFSVAANTTYDVSFYLTTANPTDNPIVSPEIDGTLLGSPAIPAGDFASNGWQQFTYTWNSGSNTSASLILHNLQTSGFGNDYGIDDIAVASATPEPGFMGVLLAGFCGLAITLRRQHA